MGRFLDMSDTAAPTDGRPRPEHRSTPVVVLGQVARDLAVAVDEVPAAGGSADVTARRELLGGKGANIAVGLTQLGVPVTLIGVVGDDAVGGWLIEELDRDGIDTRGVPRRPGTESALMIDVVTPDGRWRYLESVPSGALLTADDVRSSAHLLGEAGTVIIQLQQPLDAVLAAVDAVRPGCRVILDGAFEADEGGRRRLLRAATVLRCDAREAELIAGRAVPDADAARSVARELLTDGPDLVVLAVGEEGNLAVWPDGDQLVSLSDAEVVDTTGGGDAFVAALTWSLIGNTDPEQAVRSATAAAGLTVDHLAGRPDLSEDAVRLAARTLPTPCGTRR